MAQTTEKQGFELMKRKVSFRCDDQLHDDLCVIAKEKGITTSQLIELACYLMLEEKPKPTKQIDKLKNREYIDVTFFVNQPTFKKLVDITIQKNSTLSQEIRYRLSATLENPVFDMAELGELKQAQYDLNRLGNLFKHAIAQNAQIDPQLMIALSNQIEIVGKSFEEVIYSNHKRSLR